MDGDPPSIAVLPAATKDPHLFDTVCWDLIMNAVEANTDLLSGLYAAS